MSVCGPSDWSLGLTLALVTLLPSVHVQVQRSLVSILSWEIIEL